MIRTDGRPTIAWGPIPEPQPETPETKPYDVVGAIIAYEQGEMDEDGMVELFQHLVDTGRAWTLQGHYGRTAQDLINLGLVEVA